MTAPMSVQMTIAMSEAHTASTHTQGSLEDKLRASMHKTVDHWMCSIEDERFRAAVGGVMLDCGEGSEGWQRLADEMAGISKVSAMINAAQAGLVVDLESSDITAPLHEPLGLLKLWNEAKEA
jgi:hypothetical protein